MNLSSRLGCVPKTPRNADSEPRFGLVQARSLESPLVRGGEPEEAARFDAVRRSTNGCGDTLLHDLRLSTVRRATSLARSFHGIVEATSDVATDDEHDPEGHTIAWERQQIAALLDATRSSLAEIDAAEQRVQQGWYGICMTCGLTIAPERLAALPATPCCIDCAR